MTTDDQPTEMMIRPTRVVHVKVGDRIRFQGRDRRVTGVIPKAGGGLVGLHLSNGWDVTYEDDDAIVDVIVDAPEPGPEGPTDECIYITDGESRRTPTSGSASGPSPSTGIPSARWVGGRTMSEREEYTPDTGAVRAAYTRAMRQAFIASTSEHIEDFDR